jgi:hypothetical protein
MNDYPVLGRSVALDEKESIDTRLPMSCMGVEMPATGKNLTEARSALAE